MIWIGWGEIEVLDHFTMHIIRHLILNQMELVEEQFIFKITIYL